MSTTQQPQKDRAIYPMVVAVVFFSLMPLTLILGNAEAAPFLFAGIWRIVAAVTVFACLWFFPFPSELKNPRKAMRTVWDAVKGGPKNCPTKPAGNRLKTRWWMFKNYWWVVVCLLLGVAGALDISLFGHALRSMDKILVTVVFEIWPLIMMVLLSKMFPERFDKLGVWGWSLCFLAFIGATIAILSQAGGGVYGIGWMWVLVVSAAILSAMVRPFTMKLGIEAAKYAPKTNDATDDAEERSGFFGFISDPVAIVKTQDRSELFFTLVATMLAYAIAGVLCLGLGVFFFNEKEKLPSDLDIGMFVFAAALGGMVIQGLGGILYRIATLGTKNLGLNTLSCVVPVLAILWLWSAVEGHLFWLVKTRIVFTVPEVAYLVIGAAAIIVSNILMNARASIRSAYNILMVALWVSGALIYFPSSWEMDKEVYFQSVGVVITMYILLVAFRLDRMTTRTRDEEALSLDIAEALSRFIFVAETRLASKNDIDRKNAEADREQAIAARAALIELDRFKKLGELQKWYRKIKRCFDSMRQNAVKNYSPERKDEIHATLNQISAMESSADKFVNSKKQGHNFGEFMALFILCTVAVVILLFGVPTGLKGVGLFVTNMFAMLVSATVVFLFVNLVDLEHDREQPIMGFLKIKAKSIFGVKFRDGEKRERSFERWLSIIVCSSLIIIYGAFLWKEHCDGFNIQCSPLIHQCKGEKVSFLSNSRGVDIPAMRRYRFAQVQKELQQRDYAAVVLFDPVNIRYATDVTNMQVWVMHNRSRCAFVPAEGKAVIFEYHNCEHLSAGVEQVGELRPAISWFYFGAGPRSAEKAQKWAAAIADLTREYGGGNRRVAFDHVDPLGANALQSLGIEIHNGQEVMEMARIRKSAEEMKAMRAAIETCERALAEMEQALRPGITENEFWSILHQVNIREGGEWIETRLLSSGPRTNPWFQECSDRVIGDGELVALDTDLVGPFGYCADISRTWHCGDKKPTAEQRRLFGIAVEQIEYNSALLKAGMTFREFAESSYELPDNCKPNRYSVVAHGVGLCDEYPHICYPEDMKSGGYDGVIHDGMVLCVESYVGVAGGGEGVKLEQQVVVGESGVEVLSRYPWHDKLLA